jgi:ketopantoate reductase
MVSYEGGSYSVPHRLLGVRVHGAGRDERVVIVHVGDRGAIEVARHARAEPGSP